MSRIGMAAELGPLATGAPSRPKLGKGPRPGWVIALATGTLLGLYMLVIFRFVPEMMFLLVAAIVPFLAMIVGEIRRPLLALIILDVPFQVDVHLNYQIEIARFGALAGLGISVTTIALLGLYILWFAELLAGDKRRKAPWFHANWPMFAYIAIAGVSVFFARDSGLAFNEVFILVQTALLYVYIVGTVRTRQDVIFVVTVLVLSLLLESLVMLSMYLMGPGFRIPGLTSALDTSLVIEESPVFRATGTLRSPNVAASVLVLLLPPSLALAISAEAGRARQALGVLAFALGGVALVFAFSRGGWLAFAISMGIFSVVTIRRGWLSPGFPAAVLAAVVALFFAFQEPILARLFNEEAAQGRVPLMELAMRMIRDNPWLGVGSNNFYAAMPEHLTPEFVGAWLYLVHNKFLLIWAETGVFALAAFLLFLLTTIRGGWQVWKHGDRLLAVLGLSFTVAVIGQAIHMNFDVFNSRAQIQGLLLVAALIAVLNRPGRN